ncbi:DNA glycosylase [Mytilinidion resinicola]|uniref:DNA glycosylase n=1 Tax=Mytilinidion resinicola TaxID=574789 RepID=A0A6A6YWK5_9PEZI|nr:DNA glycosylase [Mytilinidion resinicola]KAF2812899.1 DNA glycosylase [Mytilinidion resinicola]
MARTRSVKVAAKEAAPDPTTSLDPPSTLQTFPSKATPTPRRLPKRVLPPADDASTTTSPKPSKKRRQSSKYAAPSKYSHLTPLTDILEPNLICVFVGTNPGVQTATAGHAYAHPSNHFWKLLHSSGLTPRRLSPSEDRSLPAEYCMGNTNIVARPSKDAAELSKEEIAAGTKILEEKFRRYRPEAVCIVGKGIWEGVWRWRYGRGFKKEEFAYGWQAERENMGICGEAEDGGAWAGARVFVATTTSGLAASLKPAEKEAIWRPFGEWVQKRREERGFKPESVVVGA